MTSVSSSNAHGFGNAIFFWLNIFKRQFQLSMHTELNACFSFRSTMKWAFQQDHFKVDWVWTYVVKLDFSVFKKFLKRKLFLVFKRVSKQSWIFIEFSKAKKNRFKKVLLLSQEVSLKPLSFCQVFFLGSDADFCGIRFSLQELFVIDFCLCVLNMEKQFDKVNLNDKGLFVKFWQVVAKLCLKNHFFPICPKSSCKAPTHILGPSPPDSLNLHTKKLPSVGHKILNKIRGCLWNCDKWLPSYVQKPILGPFAPNLCTRSQSPYQTKFFKEIVWKVLVIKFWIKWGVVCENLISGCRVMP